MLEFIYDLYKMDNFTLYLTIILVVLVIIFFVILIFGKKDQKLEETKRLQKIDLYSFKEDDEEPLKLEEKKKEKVEVTEFVPDKEKILTEETLSDTKELPSLKFDETELENDLKELESITEQFKNLNKKEEKSKEVLSSVYVSDEEKEEATVNQYTASDDDEDIDLPSLK